MAYDFPSGPTNGQQFTPAGSQLTYTWNGYAWQVGGSAAVALEYVLKTGDTMTGYLTLSADPTAPLHAATKQYVDAKSLPPVGLDGQALVALTGAATWGAPIEGGNF